MTVHLFVVLSFLPPVVPQVTWERLQFELTPLWERNYPVIGKEIYLRKEGRDKKNTNNPGNGKERNVVRVLTKLT